MNRFERRFPLQVGATFIIITVLAAYPLQRWGSAEIAGAALVGALLSTCNVLVGYLLIEYAFDKSYTTFLKVVLGGMGLRMALMLGVLMLLIMVCALHTVGLTVSMLLFMMIYLILEIAYLQRKVDVKSQG
jgi:hypothetical protein